MNVPTTREDLLKLIYSNGGNSPATIKFHSDGGHGWLQVPHSLLKEMSVEHEITGYSYKDDKYAYLEEDCDLGVFFNHMGLSENKTLAKEFWEVCPEDYKDHSPIRNKKGYKQ